MNSSLFEEGSRLSVGLHMCYNHVHEAGPHFHASQGAARAPARIRARSLPIPKPSAESIRL